MTVRTIYDGRRQEHEERLCAQVSKKHYNSATRRTYSKEPGSAYASNTSSREDHGHIHRTCADCTPYEKEQQRKLKSKMASVNVGDGGKQGEEDGRGKKIRGTDVAGTNEQCVKTDSVFV